MFNVSTNMDCDIDNTNSNYDSFLPDFTSRFPNKQRHVMVMMTIFDDDDTWRYYRQIPFDRILAVIFG
jgi:hypothetical protein